MRGAQVITERGVAVQGVLYQSILNAKLTGRKKLDRKMCTSNRDDRKLDNTAKQSRFGFRFGLLCHLLVLVHCVFWSLVKTVIYLEIFEHFMLPSADKLYGDADFIFQPGLSPAHTAKATKSWFNGHGVTVLDWPANSPELNPIENLWGIVKRKMRDSRPNNADDLKATIKATWASLHLSSATGWLPPCHAALMQ